MGVARKLLGAAALSLALAAGAFAQTPGSGGLKPESLLSWKWPGDPQVSPDGRRVAYVLQTSGEEGTKYLGDIWASTPGGAPVALVSHPADDRYPRWSPDGQRLAFLSNRSGKRQIWILEREGEPWRLTDSVTDIAAFAWAPDGKRIALTANPAKPGEDKADYKAPKQVMVTTERLVFRNDGTPGFRSDDISQIWMVSLPADRTARRPAQITRDAYPHAGLAWAPDGARIYFTANDKADSDFEYFDSEILSVAADGASAPVRVTDRRGDDDTPQVSPDGRMIAYFGSDVGTAMKAYEEPKLYIRNLGPGQNARVVALPHGAGDGVTTDSAPPKVPHQALAWSRDSRFVYFRAAHEGRAHLFRADARTLKVDQVSKGMKGDLSSFSVGGDRIAVLFSDPTSPPDIYWLDPRNGRAEPVTRDGDANLPPTAAGRVQERWTSSFDGQRIQSWIVTPPGFDATRKYPAILYIHGGPHAMYGETFFHEFQVLASAGYVVVYSNPRGSTGYGQAFGNIVQHRYPGDDAKDLIAALDDAIGLGFIDANRLGVAGGSGGGVLSSWLIGTYPDKFKAAVVERAVLDWSSMIGTDISLNMATVWFEDFPWKNRQPYYDRSPISLVEKVKTPALILHNAEDYRVPVQQAYQYYTSLKLLKKPAKLAVFPNSSHGMSRDGAPEQRVTRLKLILDWFDGYLKK